MAYGGRTTFIGAGRDFLQCDLIGMKFWSKHKAQARPAAAMTVLAAVLALGACWGTAHANEAPNPITVGEPPVADWASRYGRAHPLAGRLWQPAARRFVEPAALIAALAKAEFVLLGEKHDNADHHRLQAWITREVLARGRRLAVAFEMFTADHAPMIAKHLAKAPRDGAGLGPATGWSKRGWPRWRHYRPIAQAALDRGLPIIAANLSRATVMTIFAKGYGGLAPEMVSRLGLGRPEAPTMRAAMTDEIFQSHCGYLPRDRTGPMVAVQRARDAHLARSVAEALGTAKRLDGVILVTGTGHARRDRGVPMHLAHMAPGRTVVTLGLIEVSLGQNDPTAYGERFGAKALPFDFAWFTARHDNADPCQKFKEQLEGIEKKR